MPSAIAPIGAAVHIAELRHRFPNGVTAIDRIDLDVPAGQFIAILGPSGCGKSTLLRCVAGLQQTTSGSIDIEPPPHDGRSTGAWSASIAYVFQDAHLLPWRNVLRNVALPLELAGVPRAERLAAAREAIDAVGLSEFSQAYPAELSGGMRMRVSLARAMVNRPALLLLDEPFAALDEITRQRLDQQLRSLWLQRRMTVLFVTHSTAEAVFLAERAVVLSSRPGRIIADHAIDLPAERDPLLRATPRFAEQTGFVYAALEQTGAAMKRSAWLSAILPPLIVAILAGSILEAVVRIGQVRSYTFPSTSAVLMALVKQRRELLASLWITAQAALIGFAASGIVGIAAAVVLASSRWIRRALYPYTVFFQTVPIIAIAPLLVFWLEAGLQAVAVSAFIVSVFPVIASTLSGLLGTDPALVDLFRLYRAGPIARLWKLRLPAALPSILVGLRVAAGLAVIGTVVSEFLVGTYDNGGGLGVYIVSDIKYGHTDRVFAAVLLVSGLGLTLFGAVNIAGFVLLRRWHAPEQSL